MKKTKSILRRKALLFMLSMFFPVSIFALNLVESNAVLNEICDNGLTMSVHKFGEMASKYIPIDHNTHTAEVQLYNPTSGIYVISANNKSGKLLDSYKLQITID